MRCEFDMVYRNCLGLRGVARATSVVMMACVVAAVAPVFSSAHAADPAPAKKVADLAKGKASAAAVCAGCHMPDGNSVIPQNPILAGQHAAYIENSSRISESNRAQAHRSATTRSCSALPPC